MNYKTPSQVVEHLIVIAEQKTTKPAFILATLAFLAGLFIALGALGYLLVTTESNRFLGAAVFPVGLMLVVGLGAELFTSNCMIFTGILDRKITWKGLLYNLGLVYFLNFLGCIFVAYIAVKTGNFNEDSYALLRGIALSKTSCAWDLLILKGILCNVLVCASVCLCYAAQDMIGKIFAAWFPICLFVILGYDHCVANMFYLSAASFAKMPISGGGIAYNLFFATIGNILGGAILIGTTLYYCHRKSSN